jgi:C1A family cysteine protease
MAVGPELLHRIAADIAADKHRWSARPTRMLHVPESDRRHHLGYAPGPGEPSLDERERVTQHHAGRAESKVDWRARHGKNWVTRVKQQGACGSCVAFATIAAIESLVHIQQGIAVGDPRDRFPLLSEAQLFYCSTQTSHHDCHSSWHVSAALEYCTSVGLVPATDFPYTAGDQRCRLPADWHTHVTKLGAWQKLTTAAEMKDWLASKGPLISVFKLYDDFLGYSDGVYSKTKGASYEGGHSVAVVGYDDAERAWICKNSFADDWGEKGYCKIEYGQCGIDHTMWAPADFASIYAQ